MGLFAPKWLKILTTNSPYLRPDSRQVDRLEHLRRALGIPDELFAVYVHNSPATLKRRFEDVSGVLRKKHPRATDKQILAALYRFAEYAEHKSRQAQRIPLALLAEIESRGPNILDNNMERAMELTSDVDNPKIVEVSPDAPDYIRRSVEDAASRDRAFIELIKNFNCIEDLVRFCRSKGIGFEEIAVDPDIQKPINEILGWYD